MHTPVKVTLVVAITMILGAIGVTAFLASGHYNIAADAPDAGVVVALMEQIRERSIAMHAKGIEMPKLDDPELIATGAEHYAAMCTGCHLAPGADAGELRAGLYPVPPDLSKQRTRSPAETFWIIKHGIKMTAMPAWGVTHDDKAIWSLVAFLRRLPRLTMTEYRALTGAAGDDHAGPMPQSRDHPTQRDGTPGTDAHSHHHHADE